MITIRSGQLPPSITTFHHQNLSFIAFQSDGSNINNQETISVCLKDQACQANQTKPLQQTFKSKMLQHLYPQLAHEQVAHSIWPKTQQTNVSYKLQKTQTEMEIFSPFQEEKNTVITGQLVTSNENVSVFVDGRHLNELDQQTVLNVSDTFNRITLPRLRILFGNESDIDQNKKIILFFTSEQKMGTGVLGFFRPLDIISSISGVGTLSNQAEILYLKIPNPDEDISLLNATIAHEVFHLIHFSNKTYQPKRTQSNAELVFEETFLNEGLAHLAEEITGFGVCTPLLVKIFLECFQTTSLTNKGLTSENESCQPFDQNGDGLSQRGGMLLFLLYLLQQNGDVQFLANQTQKFTGQGMNLIKTLMTSKLTGITNIEQSTGENFFDLLAHFYATLVLDNKSKNISKKHSLKDQYIDDVTGHIRNIRMQTKRKVGEEEISLDGIASLPFENLGFTSIFTPSMGVALTPFAWPLDISIHGNTNSGLVIISYP